MDIKQSNELLFEIRTFGGLEVQGPNGLITNFGSGLARSVLAVLATSDEPVHRKTLSEQLWPDELFSVARPRLRTEIHRLREALGEASCVVEIGREWLRIDDKRANTDLKLFSGLRAEAVAAVDAEHRYQLLIKAVEGVRGPLTPHESGKWCLSLRAEWQGKALEAFEAAAKLGLDLGHIPESIAISRRGLSLFSDRASLILLLMQAMVVRGEVQESLAVFDDYVDRLAAQSDLAPDRLVVKYAANLRREYARKIPSGSPDPSQFRELPPKTDAVFGREAFVASLRENLKPGAGGPLRIFNLIGPGGMGKTTVALEVARDLALDYRGRVFFVPLAAVSDLPSLVIQVLESINAAKESPDPLKSIVQTLKGFPALLVLDNFEQLVPSGVSWLATLAKQLPEVRIVVTSRCALNLSIEQRVSLPPLSADSSIQVFVDRARRILPGYEPHPEERDRISELATRLEGLPLGLVLAAARVQTLGPAEILRDLNALSKVPTSSRDAETRHQSLHLAIQWSLDLLDKDSREFLTRLAVFPADWDLQAARRLADDSNGNRATETKLAALVDQSLVAVDISPRGSRFRLLPMIRETLFDLTPLADSRHKDHALYYADLVESAYQSHPTNLSQTAALLQPEKSNIESSLEWLRSHLPKRYRRMIVGMTGFWCSSQNEPRAADWALGMLTEDQYDSEEDRGDHRFVAARLLLEAGRYDEAESNLIESTSIFEGLGLSTRRLQCLRYKTHLSLFRGNFRQMELECSDLIRAAEELQESLMQGFALSDLALAQQNLGKGEAALQSLSRCVAVHQERKDQPRILTAMQTYAAALLSLRRWHEAERILLQILEANQTYRLPAQEVQCRMHLTTVCVRTGRLDEAGAHLQFILDPSQPSAHAYLRGVRHYIAVLYWVQRKDRREAERSVRSLFQAWNSVANGPGILPAVDMVAYALASFGELREAKRLLDLAEATRTAKDIMISPHYSLTHEDARNLVGPYEPTDPADDFSSLTAAALQAVWLL